MIEILNNGGSLQGKHREGILWSKDDAFAQVMGKERCGRIRGVGFGPTPTGRSGSNLPCLTGPSSSEMTHWMIELENSLGDQLAQLELRHQGQIASLHARHKEEIAEARRQSDAWHEQQMTEMMSGVRAMLEGIKPLVPTSQIS